ncbi:MAG: AraC family transcriptional regulator [Bacilli bacterium]
MRTEFKEKLMILTEEEMVLLKFQRDSTINAINPDEVIKGNDLYIDNDIKIRKLSRFTYFCEHEHEYVELIYGINGTVKHFVNNQQLNLREDNFIILNSSALHCTKQTDINDMAINFNLHIDYVNRLIEELNDDNIKEFIRNICFGDRDYLFIENPSDDFKVLIESLVYYLVNNKFNIVEIKSFIDFSIKNFFVSSYRNSTIKHITDEHDIQHKLITYIKSNFTVANLEEFSEICGYSYSECSKLVKKIMNKNFKDVVRLYRLEIAAKLLRDSDYSITKISRYIGYENINYFYKIFTEEYGCAPSKYRNN